MCLIERVASRTTAHTDGTRTEGALRNYSTLYAMCYEIFLGRSSACSGGKYVAKLNDKLVCYGTGALGIHCKK